MDVDYYHQEMYVRVASKDVKWLKTWEMKKFQELPSLCSKKKVIAQEYWTKLVIKTFTKNYFI